jgi:hypothetical protein
MGLALAQQANALDRQASRAKTQAKTAQRARRMADASRLLDQAQRQQDRSVALARQALTFLGPVVDRRPDLPEPQLALATMQWLLHMDDAALANLRAVALGGIPGAHPKRRDRAAIAQSRLTRLVRVLVQQSRTLRAAGQHDRADELASRARRASQATVDERWVRDAHAD